ncbi:TetR family transcriptional regulator [Rhizobium sp. PP-WC-2G-219]|uniref:TetR/AcrR family transcriptional regulator n=1 Tax=Ferranicluibacter rubi TaxID=2715133 RepID=A0AA43ZHQ7_9HYPH|nr:TetR/AcrR family transcriptional regulator [Ferranicluibacter rubi]PYE26964.1 TetR family transcriptional regulator [Rhizobium sp. PP-CC-3A-592]TCL93911.1 TetR family transcriptional regulator [Rhizobium sp. PP-WC-2G-219]TCP90527.1 TetR family transcriptional regulator [Rhizobium sp. PP-CC-2G-626]TCQ10029.1 TetR family transcriptional regulator [Rhizobium sp. PP-F2F-G36]TCQ27888.1 TetR family transcriptional regulator [Rhizobium sp. PP-CC-3G-465]
MSSLSTQPEFSPRQNAVLDSALRLLVDGGERALTTAGVARAANCSKESLYKWFGDRDGILSAMIGYQASKVRTLEERAETLTVDSLRAHLVVFARDLLDVLSGDVSLALNRLAIGQASRDGSHLGQMLQERGRRQIGKRAGGLLDAGRRAGLLRFDNGEEAYGMLYGLVVTDLHLRMLLGEDMKLTKQDFSRRAERAVDAFLDLCGTKKQTAKP